MNRYPHFTTKHATLWHTDALELLTASVEAVIADPPYAPDKHHSGVSAHCGMKAISGS